MLPPSTSVDTKRMHQKHTSYSYKLAHMITRWLHHVDLLCQWTWSSGSKLCSIYLDLPNFCFMKNQDNGWPSLILLMPTSTTTLHFAAVVLWFGRLVRSQHPCWMYHWRQTISGKCHTVSRENFQVVCVAWTFWQMVHDEPWLFNMPWCWWSWDWGGRQCWLCTIHSKGRIPSHKLLKAQHTLTVESKIVTFGLL